MIRIVRHMATKAKDKVPKRVIIPSEDIPDYDLEANPYKIEGEQLKEYKDKLKQMIFKNKSKPLI